jgi:hypothetical protein
MFASLEAAQHMDNEVKATAISLVEMDEKALNKHKKYFRIAGHVLGASLGLVDAFDLVPTKYNFKFSLRYNEYTFTPAVPLLAYLNYRRGLISMATQGHHLLTPAKSAAQNFVNIHKYLTKAKFEAVKKTLGAQKYGIEDVYRGLVTPPQYFASCATYSYGVVMFLKSANFNS